MPTNSRHADLYIHHLEPRYHSIIPSTPYLLPSDAYFVISSSNLHHFVTTLETNLVIHSPVCPCQRHLLPITILQHIHNTVILKSRLLSCPLLNLVFRHTDGSFSTRKAPVCIHHPSPIQFLFGPTSHAPIPSLHHNRNFLRMHCDLICGVVSLVQLFIEVHFL